MAQIGKALDHVILNRGAGIGFAKDEVLIAKSLPFDRIVATKNVSLGENSEYAFSPELRDLAIGNGRRTHDEGNIQASLPNQSEMLARCELENLKRHLRVLFAERSHQLTEKTCRDRRADANPQMAILAATSGPGNGYGVVKLGERKSRALEKFSPSHGNAHTAVVPFEERDPKHIFE
jgi:hypothetical protein